MTETGLLEIICDRLGRAETAEAFFGADETAGWPPGALDALVENGLLRRAPPTHIIECQGCEENCLMPVFVLPVENHRPARAFIACDKRDNVGRVPVDFRRLRQWQTTGGLVAAMLARLPGFNQCGLETGDGQPWTIGVLKGRKHKSPVALLVRDGLKLSLAGHVVPLIGVLTIKDHILAVDKDELIRLVDTPAGDAETPEQRRTRLQVRIGQEKAKGTKAFLRVVAQEEGISHSRLKQLVSDHRTHSDILSRLSATQQKGASSKKIKPKH